LIAKAMLIEALTAKSDGARAQNLKHLALWRGMLREGGEPSDPLESAIRQELANLLDAVRAAKGEQGQH